MKDNLTHPEDMLRPVLERRGSALVLSSSSRFEDGQHVPRRIRLFLEVEETHISGGFLRRSSGEEGARDKFSVAKDFETKGTTSNEPRREGNGSRELIRNEDSDVHDPVSLLPEEAHLLSVKKEG